MSGEIAMISTLRHLAYNIRTRPALARLALAVIPDLAITRDIPGLGPLRLRLRTNRAHWLREPMEFEIVPFTLLASLVRRGDVVYDCGANLGLYARHLIQNLGAGRVVAFEPDEDNLLLLAANLKLGGISDRVDVVAAAVSDQDGTSLFQKDDKSSASGTLDRVTGGGASVGRQNLELPPLTVSVPTVCLDTIAFERGLPAADVIKVDVEGAAAFLLAGARRLLSEQKPSLLIELHGAEEAIPVLECLFEAGYHCAGKVDRRLDPRGYCEIDRTMLPHITGLYDVHFLVATADRERLPRSLELP